MLPVTNNKRSPLEVLSSQRFGGGTFQQFTKVNVLGSISQILPNNPNRLAWYVVNNALYDLWLYPADISDLFNYVLTASRGGIVSRLWEEDGDVVGYAVWGQCIYAAISIDIYEVIRS